MGSRPRKTIAAKAKSRLMTQTTMAAVGPTPPAGIGRWGEKSRWWVFNRSLVYRESVFEPGASVVVGGMGRREPDPDAAAAGEGYRDRPTRLVIEPLAGTLYLSNEPRTVEAAIHT